MHHAVDDIVLAVLMEAEDIVHVDDMRTMVLQSRESRTEIEEAMADHHMEIENHMAIENHIHLLQDLREHQDHHFQDEPENIVPFRIDFSCQRIIVLKKIVK